MKLRKVVVGVLALAMLLAMSVPALAGNPHFVGQPQVDNVDGVLTVSGKVAGLGNEEQIFVEVTALAECVNPGGKKPSAENKDEVSISGTFPVQNGKADFLLELDGAAQITPSCEPPMTIEYSDVFIGVDTNGDGIADLTRFFAGPF